MDMQEKLSEFYTTMDIQEELSGFVRVWGLAIWSAVYCYTLNARTKAGLGRLVLVSPVMVLFTTLPFALNTISLGAATFFYLTWLGNFKLLLFAMGSGPLISQPSKEPLSLLHFAAIALLPIKLKDDEDERRRKSVWVPPNTRGKQARKLLAFLWATWMITCKDSLSRPVLQLFYFVHVSMAVEIVLAVTAVPVTALLGLQLEDQFRDPYLATSLQDFWGSRWNLMTSNILRLTVHNPLSRITSPMLGKRWSLIAGILGSFTVSGFMHELTYYHYTRVSPTWEVTWFFILHGVCTAIEIVLKIMLFRKWQPNRLVSMLITSSFVATTATWLFMPQLLRNKIDERLLSEYFIIIDIVKSMLYV
ncbi:hypothetical protein V2J09_012541 [Rumex salicifolius]